MTNYKVELERRRMTNIEELDRRLRVLEDRLSPAETVAVEPEWAAGTAGTATVRVITEDGPGLVPMRVMRTTHPRYPWVTERNEHPAEADVTDFVPDDLNVDLLRRRITREVNANLQAARERDEARAEVERLRDQLAAVETYGPRPAFVLPEREAVAQAIDPDTWTNPRSNAEDAEEAREAADRVLALLAEHAVTEERLTDAMQRSTGWLRPACEKRAAAMLARLTGKAEG